LTNVNGSENSMDPNTVLEELATVLKPVSAHDWLFTPNPLLDHHKPVDFLREGEHCRVLGVIDVLAEGVFV
jgi:uncharacterized protein (DUF2384 family)